MPARTPATSIFKAAIEALEERRLFCALHGFADDVGPADYMPALAAATARSGADHSASWYKASRRVTIKPQVVAAGMIGPSSAKAAAAASASGAASGSTGGSGSAISFTTNAAGLPLLSSRPGTTSVTIFLDYDGNGSNTAFDTDGTASSFGTTEQQQIYDGWRDIVSFYSPLNINVTTDFSTVTTSKVAWLLISNSITGGYAYVNTVGTTSPTGFVDEVNGTTRHSGMAHELGHILGLQHQSDWSNWGEKVEEYTNGYDQRHGSIIGVDYGQTVHKWYNGRNSTSADTFQNDLSVMAGVVAGKVGGDGYMPDDYTGTSGATAATLSLTNGSYAATGDIERNNDADYFKFTSAGEMFNINVEPTFESGLAPKLELFDNTDKLIAARDDSSWRTSNDNTGFEFTLNLPAGTYYAKVSGHGDYGDQGEYSFNASPLPSGWMTQDVTANGTGRGGYVTYDASTGTFYNAGSGSDVATSSDNFRFTYQVLNGAGSITARITGLDNTNASAKAGLMIRESLSATSKMAMIDFKPSGSEIRYRTTNGGSVSTTGSPTLSLPNWIRLSRSGNTITLFQSTDGVNFGSAVGTVTLSSLATQVYLGLATNSHNVDKIAVATFTNVSLTGTLGATAATFNALAAPTGLTATAAATQSTAMNLSWTDTNTTETGYAIDRSTDGVNFTRLTTVAANITTYTDDPAFGSMRWWYRVSALSGATNSTYSNVATVINKPSAPSNVQMISVSTTKLSLSWRDVSGDTGYRIERSTDGGANYSTLTPNATNINTFNNSSLTSGSTYTYRITPLSAVGDGVPVVVNGTTRIAAVTGLAFTSKASNAMAMSWSAVGVATGYNVERSTDNETFSVIGSTTTALNYTDSTVSPLKHYYYRVVGTIPGTESQFGTTIFSATPAATANVLPSPWLNADIGSVAGMGASGLSGSTYTVIGSGDNITGTSDQFQFAYRPLTGDGEIIAHVASLENINDNTSAGIMIRESLANNARMAMVKYQSSAGDLGTDLATRTTTGGSVVSTDGAASSGSYLRLTRVGNVFTAYYATTSGGTWVQIGSATTIAMAANAYVGFTANAYDSTMMATATFNGVTVTSTNTAPTVATIAAANPSPVTGTTTALSVLGADDGGESNLTYTWAATTVPAGASAPTFSVSGSTNGTNAAKNAVATFSAPGTYGFTVTITDALGLTTTSAVNVNVVSTLTSLSIAPTSPTLQPGATQQFTATGLNQFGAAFSPLPTLTWSVTGNPASISSSGLFTAPARAGVSVVQASANGGTVSANVNVRTALSGGEVQMNGGLVPTLSVAMNGDLLTSTIQASDLSLFNATTGETTFGASYSYNGATDVLTFTLPSSMTDGAYTATMASGSVSDVNASSLSSAVTYNFIYAGGTSGADTYRAQLNSAGTITQLFKGDETSASITTATASLGRIILNGQGGDDTFIVDRTDGNPLPTAGLTVDGGAGTGDTLRILGAATADSVTFDAGLITLGGSIVHANFEKMEFDGKGGNDTVVVNSGALTFLNSQHLASLSLANGTTATVASAGNSTLVTDSLVFNGNSTLDLNDNDLILNYTGQSQLEAVKALVKSAYNGGNWLGSGITSSAARTNTAKNTTLAALEAADYKSARGGSGATLNDELIGNNAVVLKYSYYGDADLNGKLDFDDYARIDTGFNNQGQPNAVIGWFTGDFDGNGVIDFDDYARIDVAFNTQAATL